MVILLELAHAASSPEPSATAHQHIEPNVNELLKRVERDQAKIEADVRLFGDRAARQKLEEVHALVALRRTEALESRVEELAVILRGPFYRRLAPQRRWFR